ncbi:MAG: aminopeptidase P family protein [Chloroflexi bacterium]|nr:aminopeptidase P family protein [Chloroflexota bacterium]
MQARLERLRAQMKSAGIDALVCRLPENVMFLTDYWPHHGFSAVVFPPDGQPQLFAPSIEEPFTHTGWAEVSYFGWGMLTDGDLYANLRRFLGEALAKYHLKGAVVAFEKSFEVIGTTYRSSEPVVPSGPWRALVEEVFAEARLVDGADVLQTARAIKGDYEIEKLRRANEIAEMGMHEFLAKLQPGMSEIDVSALIEYTIRTRGAGYKGAQLVRAWAEVAAGVEGTTRATLVIPSRNYKIREGDLVMVEMAVVVDGYWSDLTYMAVAGTPSARQREVHNHVLAAQQAAARAVKAGNTCEAPDTAARQVLQQAGLAEYYPHVTGHAVGFRYHEFIPFLMPGSSSLLEAGMTTSVEPGVYIPGFGGIRIEDNVVVGADGPIYLSTPRQPW